MLLGCVTRLETLKLHVDAPVFIAQLAPWALANLADCRVRGLEVQAAFWGTADRSDIRRVLTAVGQTVRSLYVEGCGVGDGRPMPSLPRLTQLRIANLPVAGQLAVVRAAPGLRVLSTDGGEPLLVGMSAAQAGRIAHLDCEYRGDDATNNISASAIRRFGHLQGVTLPMFSGPSLLSDLAGTIVHLMIPSFTWDCGVEERLADPAWLPRLTAIGMQVVDEDDAERAMFQAHVVAGLAKACEARKITFESTYVRRRTRATDAAATSTCRPRCAASDRRRRERTQL